MADSDDDRSIEAQVTRHGDRNKVVHRVFREAGGDARAEREIDLFFKCPDEASAQVLADALADARVLKAHTSKLESGSGWYLHVTYWGTVAEVTDPSFTERVVRLAATAASAYDGWGAEVHMERPQ